MPLTAPFVLLPTSPEIFLPKSLTLPTTSGILILGIFGILIFLNINYFSFFQSVHAPYPIAPHAAILANGPAIRTITPHNISTAPSQEVLSSTLSFTHLIGFIIHPPKFQYIYLVYIYYFYVIITTYMKRIILILAFLSLTNCSIPKDPELVFGKKCLSEGEQVTYSYVWIYDKSLGNKPTVEQCDQIAD